MLRTVMCRARSGLLKQPRTTPVFWGTRAQQQPWATSLPKNRMILFVPQQEAWVVERLGCFHRVLKPGLNLLIPILERISYVQSLKEMVIDVPEQSAISLDHVTLQINGVLCLRILDPFKASYAVEDPKYAVTQLAQTTIRSELGKLTLDQVLRHTESLDHKIQRSISQASADWGIHCLRYSIKSIHIPPDIEESMRMQVGAEWKKRATVLESEGTRESAINVAEGRKQTQILASEGEKAVQINKAEGEAIALLLKAEAKGQAIRILTDALSQKKVFNLVPVYTENDGPRSLSCSGSGCRSTTLAVNFELLFRRPEQNFSNSLTRWLRSFIASSNDERKCSGVLQRSQSNTVILPSNTGDVSRMVIQVFVS
ncbi:stomatin-like protein 2, mitochondrial [Clarias gariepinus]